MHCTFFSPLYYASNLPYFLEFVLFISLLIRFETDSSIAKAFGLWVGRSGVRFSEGLKDFSLPQKLYTRFEVHPASYSKGTGDIFQGESRKSLKVSTRIYHHLVPRGRTSGAITLPCLQGVDGGEMYLFSMIVRMSCGKYIET